MKKKIVTLILLCGLLACMYISPALGAGYGTAIIDGGNADRVHLRERASASANSMGLYFTGTQVVCESDPNKEWVEVTIGSHTGYMKSEFLYRGSNPGSIKPKQPAAVVHNIKAGSWVNLREAPSQSTLVTGKLYYNDEVTVLGQTASKWYYVKAGDLYGYIMPDYLLIGGSTPSNPGNAYGTAIIDGKSSDRVHLRERASTGANSMGLYFTGTKVVCETDPNKEWVEVTIGSHTGYIKSEFLYRGSNPGSIKPRQPAAVVHNIKAGSWVNLREAPSQSTSVTGILYYNDEVTVLGQTASKWYYVQAGDLYGYIMPDYLLVGGSSPSNPGNAYGTAIIDGKSSDRVHLRERASASAKSMGLYFTGTKVVYESDPTKEWVEVTIGCHTGYMKSEFLYRGSNPGSITPEQPAAVVHNVKAGSWVNLREAPSQSTAVVSKLYNGDSATVLGQTASLWYYIKTDDQYGYIMPEFLAVGD